jgi:hypothetical protein
VIKTGKLEKAVKLSGLAATKGARAAIEAVGGSIANEPVRPEKAKVEKAWQKTAQAEPAAKAEKGAKTEKTAKAEKAPKDDKAGKSEKTPAQQKTKD